MDGKIAALAATGMFEGWTAAEMRRLARAADLVHLARGETLIPAGTRHAGCYLLLSGAVVTATEDGSRLTSAAGELVGLAEALTGIVARGDTAAMRPTTVLAFPAAQFDAMLEVLVPLRRLALKQMAAATIAQPRTARPTALALV